jgi:hypothetical protein
MFINCYLGLTNSQTLIHYNVKIGNVEKMALYRYRCGIEFSQAAVFRCIISGDKGAQFRCIYSFILLCFAPFYPSMA